jgi:branched-subunit amino acid permease
MFLAIPIYFPLFIIVYLGCVFNIPFSSETVLKKSKRFFTPTKIKIKLFLLISLFVIDYGQYQYNNSKKASENQTIFMEKIESKKIE